MAYLLPNFLPNEKIPYSGLQGTGFFYLAFSFFFEEGIHGIGGGAGQAVCNMLVEVLGDDGIRVPELPRYEFDVNALLQKEGGGGVAKVMDPEVGEPCFFQKCLEFLVDPVWSTGVSILMAEDQTIIGVTHAEEHAVPLLPQVHAPQGIHCQGGNVYFSGGGFGLCFIDDEGRFF